MHEVSLFPSTRKYHIYCSKLNEGSLELMGEMAQQHGWLLNVPRENTGGLMTAVGHPSSKGAKGRSQFLRRFFFREQKEELELLATQTYADLANCDHSMLSADQPHSGARQRPPNPVHRPKLCTVRRDGTS